MRLVDLDLFGLGQLAVADFQQLTGLLSESAHPWECLQYRPSGGDCAPEGRTFGVPGQLALNTELFLGCISPHSVMAIPRCKSSFPILQDRDLGH